MSGGVIEAGIGSLEEFESGCKIPRAVKSVAGFVVASILLLVAKAGIVDAIVVPVGSVTTLVELVAEALVEVTTATLVPGSSCMIPGTTLVVAGAEFNISTTNDMFHLVVLPRLGSKDPDSTLTRDPSIHLSDFFFKEMSIWLQIHLMNIRYYGCLGILPRLLNNLLTAWPRNFPFIASSTENGTDACWTATAR